MDTGCRQLRERAQAQGRPRRARLEDSLQAAVDRDERHAVGGPLEERLVGAGCGGLLAARIGHSQRTHIGVALATEIVLITIATILAAIVSVRAGAASGAAVIALLALAMGVRNATMRHVGVVDLTTTVLTGTLTNLATGLPVFGGSGQATARRLMTVLAMLLGALVGALLLQVSLVLPMAAAAGLAALSWVAFVH